MGAIIEHDVVDADAAQVIRGRQTRLTTTEDGDIDLSGHTTSGVLGRHLHGDPDLHRPRDGAQPVA